MWAQPFLTLPSRATMSSSRLFAHATDRMQLPLSGQSVDQRYEESSKPCVLRIHDLKKAFSAESVSSGFSSGRK